MKLVEKAKPDNLVVFNETIKGDKASIHLLVEYPRTTSRAEQYYSALRDSRNIPFDLDAINPLDSMYRFVYENFPSVKGKPEQAKERVRYFYQQQSTQAYRDAVMLAVTSSSENKFDFEPTEYAPEDLDAEDNLPGLVAVPQPVRNLENPTERRLKQIFDVLKSDVTMIAPFAKNFELAVIAINELLVVGQTDDAGFHPVTANKS